MFLAVPIDSEPDEEDIESGDDEERSAIEEGKVMLFHYIQM